jgi:hypothetical protein
LTITEHEPAQAQEERRGTPKTTSAYGFIT